MTVSSSLRVTALVLIGLAACASALIGVEFALRYSQDLQWDEARLFLDGINPYRFFFEPELEPPDYVIGENLGLTQPPSAVLLFAPITLASFETAKIVWIGVNLAATIAFVLLAVRLFHPRRLSRTEMAALTLLLVASMPWRITVGNGQYGLVAMVFFLLALRSFRARRVATASLFASLALVKYTLVLPFFALFLDRKRDLALVLGGALLVHAGLTAVAGLLVGERPDLLVRHSLAIAASIAESGAWDVFAVQGRLAPALGPAAPALLSLLMVALTVAMCWRGVSLRELAALSIVAIVIVYHRSYDAVVLFFLVLHLHALAQAANPLSWRTGWPDLIEIWAGSALLLHIFLIDQFVYELGGREVHAQVSVGVSALLYAYLFFLMGRSFLARARRPDAATSAASP